MLMLMLVLIAQVGTRLKSTKLLEVISEQICQVHPQLNSAP